MEPAAAGKLKSVRLGRLTILVLLVLVAVGAGLAYRYYWLHRYDKLINGVAPIYKLDPQLVRAVIHEESYFMPQAKSGAGAHGLMQVTDPVIEEWREERGYRSMPDALERRVIGARMSDAAALDDPEVNVHIGCWYLAKLIDRFHDEPEPYVVALAAYNAGSTHAERWLKARPAAADTPAERVDAFVNAIDFPETKAYVRDVRERYREATRAK